MRIQYTSLFKVSDTKGGSHDEVEVSIMIIRSLSSALLGATVTAGLLLLMHTLIETSHGAVVVDAPRHEINFVRVKKESKLHTIDDRLPDPIEVVDPPPISPVNEWEPGAAKVTIPISERPEVPAGAAVLSGRTMDGPLVSIVSVQPAYPVTASQRGLEGFVVVQFDVTETGLVENVSVVDSSHSLFEKSAVRAAYRARFKPRVVEGQALASKGLQRLFTFEMKK